MVCYLSFLEKDTQENIISHLDDALKQKEVEIYIDFRPVKGDEISPGVIEAIEESLISIVVFSENYASSMWSLDEISKIIECKKNQGQVVIPVFYKIDPSYVRNQRGSYEEAFAKYERDLKSNHDKVQKWRVALREAANLCGVNYSIYRDECEFIKEIVKVVLQKLKFIYPNEFEEPVGMKGNYAWVESLLEIGYPEVRMIGICGMPGTGKTNLANFLYDKLLTQFKGHCFLPNVRKQSEKDGLDSLRSKIFSELLEEKLEECRVMFHSVRRKLGSKKVLIVLDDVATSEQLENLISDFECLEPGSRVIVTTRDEHIFGHVDGISVQLLCLNPVREKHANNGYEVLSESVDAHCKGNPMALNVGVAHVPSRSQETRKCELRNLQKTPDMKTRSSDIPRHDYVEVPVLPYLQPTAIGLRVEGSDHNNEDDQTKKLQEVKHQTITRGMQNEKVNLNENSSRSSFIVSALRGCEGKSRSSKEEDCYISSIPKNQIIPFDTPSTSNNSNQTIEVSQEKDLINNQVDKGSEPVMSEKADTHVEIDNLRLEPALSPIGQIERMLSDSFIRNPMPTNSTTVTETECQDPNVAAILEKLKTLFLETSLEIVSSNDEVKQQFFHVSKQLVQFKDQVPGRLHPIIYGLKAFIEIIDVRFGSAQKTIQNYDQLLHSRSFLSKQFERFKAREHQINSKVSQGKIDFENINIKIAQFKQQLSVLFKTRVEIERALDSYDVENSKLTTQVEQWRPKCETIIKALEESRTSYKEALTNKKEAEDDWAYLKTFCIS